jgi:hypothetical protein
MPLTIIRTIARAGFKPPSGITITNTNTNIGTSLNYGNPDLGFSKFEGTYDASDGGSVKNWKIIGSATNNEHNHATGTGSNANVIGASVAKLYYDKGGLVFYIGNHSFPTNSSTGINGIRMYMNAFHTPSTTNCPAQVFMALATKLLNFSVSRPNNKTAVSWSVSKNEWADHFDLERSLDGHNFSLCSSISSNNKTGEVTCQFAEPQSALRIFYRLKIVDKKGMAQYSEIVSNDDEKNNQVQLAVFGHSTKGDLTVGYTAYENTPIDLHVYNYLGILLFSAKIKCDEGNNYLKVPARFIKGKGICYIEVIENGRKRLKSKAERF